MRQISCSHTAVTRLKVRRILPASLQALAAGVGLLCIAASVCAAGAALHYGWTRPKIVIPEARQDLRGYAATAYQGRAYVVDITDAHAGGRNTSQIWFSTNSTGKWVHSLVAALPDDPDTDGAAMPQIAVVPTNGLPGSVVIAFIDNTSAGGILLSYGNQFGRWEQLALISEVNGDAAIHNEQAPAFAVIGGIVTLAFNATYMATTATCSQNGGNVFVSTLGNGASAWPPPRNVTQDYCQPSLFARSPVLAYDPSGVLYLLYQYSGDPNSLNGLRLRSGTLSAGTEEVVEPAPASGTWELNSALGLYAMTFDAHGVPQVVYRADAGSTAIAARLMYAVRGAGGWTCTVLHQADKPGADTDVASMPPAIAAGDSGITVAFVGAATYPLGGSGAQAVYLMNMNGGSWSPPVNITRSRYTDNTPILAVSNGLKHLFMLREGVGYLYARELPYPQISTRLAGVATLSGGVTPATAPEVVSLCLEHMLSATRWSGCQSSGVHTAIQGGAGQFTHAFNGLAAGSYRVHVAVPETDDHLAGVGNWLNFSVP